MRKLLILILAFSTFLVAEDYKYEPVANKAEYFMGKFNKNKDMDDLLKWGDKFVDWMESRKHASAIQAIKSNFKDFQHKELLKAKKNPEDKKVQNELVISDKVINRITGQIFGKLKDLDEKELETVYKLFSLDKDAL